MEKSLKENLKDITPSSKQKVGMYMLLWVFIIGGIFGVIIEMIYGFVIDNEIQRRSGVIYGPFNPVYAFGALTITIFLYEIRKRKGVHVFIASMIIGAGFEFLCSLFQEFAYGTVSWEYSNTILNICGRTNLAYSIFWGMLGLFWIKVAYPWLVKVIRPIPKKVGVPLVLTLIVLLILDMAISSMAAIRQLERRKGVLPSNSIERYIDKKYNDKVMKKAYPNAVVR